MNYKLLIIALVIFSANSFAQENTLNQQDYNIQDPNYVNYEDTFTNENESYNNSYYNSHMDDKKLNIEIVAASKYSKKYKGADDYTLNSFIMPNISYKLDDSQKLFLSFENGAGYSYMLTPNLEMGAGFGYRTGRESSDAAILSGMQDIDDTLTYKTFAQYNYEPFGFKVELEKGMKSSNDGLTTKFSAGYSKVLNNQLTVGSKISATYGDSNYMQQTFGVSSADANGNRSAYKPSAGFAETNLDVFAKYNISGPHNIIAGIGYSKLLGDAKNSSIVENETDLSFTTGYSYKF
jgi:MipA family protein